MRHSKPGPLDRCHHCGSATPHEQLYNWDSVCRACGQLTWIAPQEIRPVLVTQLTEFGIFVDVGDGTHGLIHITELSEQPVNHPSEVVEVGQVVDTMVLRIDMVGKRIGLSIRRAHRNSSGIARL